MAKYRKKSVVIDAWKFEAGNPNMPPAWLGDVHSEANDVVFGGDGETIYIATLEGTMTARDGDYIIRGVKGEFYPCKPDIFEATYEPAE